jgi:hypothetical protein
MNNFRKRFYLFLKKLKFDSNIYLGIVFVFLLCFSLDYVWYGPGITGDTVHYLTLASKWKNGVVPNHDLYLVGYPYVLSLFSSLFNLSLYKSVYFFQGVLFIINVAFFTLLSKKICKHFDLGVEKSYILILILLSFWNFRLQKVAHADALFFTLFIIYIYVFFIIYEKNKLYAYFGLSFLLSMMVQVKYNAYLLVPFTVMAIFIIKNYNYKSGIKGILVVFPSIVSIYIWKAHNGAFISRLETTNYSEASMFDFISFYKSLGKNFQELGQTILEVLINPVISRLIPNMFTLTFGMIFFLLFVYFFIKTKNAFLKLLLLYVIFYCSAFFIMNSYNGISETNLRTLNTVVFIGLILLFLFLSLSRFLVDKLIYLNIFIMILSVNTLLLSYKWFTNTSKNNNFHNIEFVSNKYNIDYTLPDSLKDNVILTNSPNYLQFPADYSLDIREVFIDKQFSKDAIFVKLSLKELDQLADNLIKEIDGNAVFYFNFPDSENELHLLERLKSSNVRWAKRGVDSYLFYN